jgi:protease secretion system outer membrane protein
MSKLILLSYKNRHGVIAALIASYISAPCYGLNLMESFNAALDNDPKFQGARFDKIAGEENEAIGLSGLLPNLTASYNYSKNDADRTTIFSNGLRQNDSPQYDSKVTTISVRQPIFNKDAWQRYKGGQAQSNYSNSKFLIDLQDLIARITTAYLNVLLSEDQLVLAIAQRDAYHENQLVNQQLYEKGAGTLTDIMETRARFELAQAQVVEAQDNVSNRRNEFASIIGRDPGVLDGLIGMLPDLPLVPNSLKEWEMLAREHNPDVLAKRYSVDYAQTEVERIRAGHYPRADLVASHSRNTADSLYTYNQQSTVNTVGIQVVVPIYSGGSINAQTRQAAARLASSRASFDTTLQNTLIEVRKQFSLLTSSRIRIAAIEQAELAAEETVKATRMSVIGGHRVNLDVLNAVRQLYTTRYDLSEARHNYLLAYMRLHSASGLLNDESLGRIANCFKATP